jgi:hypothetical protein
MNTRKKNIEDKNRTWPKSQKTNNEEDRHHPTTAEKRRRRQPSGPNGRLRDGTRNNNSNQC